MLPKYGSILQYYLGYSDNLNEWKASFKSRTDSASHLELPNMENVPLVKDMPNCSSLSLCLMPKICHYSFVFCKVSTN